MKLAKEDVVRMDDASPLDLFRQSIKSEETLDKYERTLRQVTCEFFEDVLKEHETEEVAFEERVARLVRRGREDPLWARDLLISLSAKLRERTRLDRDDRQYLNPDSFANYFKPIKKLFEMNDVPVLWPRIYATYPEPDNRPGSRGWTREEIALMLEHAGDAMDRALILVLASSGVRVGGLDLKWGDVRPIYEVDGRLTMDPDADTDNKVACAVLEVYSGSAESYNAFITPEAHHALQRYGSMWQKSKNRPPRPDDPVFITHSGGVPRKARPVSIRKRLTRVVNEAGLRGAKKGKRYGVPIIQGFRRFFNKTGKDALSDDSRVSSLIKKEYMLGHQGLVKLDQNYYKTDALELAAAYVEIVPDLTIGDAERLRRSNRAMAGNIRRMEDEKDVEIERLKGQVRSMEERMSELGDGGARADELLRAIRGSPESGGVPGDVMEALRGMMDGLAAAHDSEIRKMRAEYDAKMDKVLRAMDEMGRKGGGMHDPLGKFRDSGV